MSVASGKRFSTHDRHRSRFQGNRLWSPSTGSEYPLIPGQQCSFNCIGEVVDHLMTVARRTGFEP